jgi:hypothetical protein
MFVAMASALPAFAAAEEVQSGNLVMSLRGRLAPLQLPRDRAVPVGVTLVSRISTSDGTPVPKLRRIEIAFGGGAAIAADGLAICPRGRLRNATGAEALGRCSAALVGRGSLPLEIRLPGHLPLRRDPRVLIFNGRGPGGEAVLWMHVFAAKPPVSFVVAFRIHRDSRGRARGLAATLPRSVTRWARVRGFEVSLRRRYRSHGQSRGYLSASCPVPRPLTAGYFPLVRATFVFAGNRRLSEEIVRTCRVRP